MATQTTITKVNLLKEIINEGVGEDIATVVMNSPSSITLKVNTIDGHIPYFDEDPESGCPTLKWVFVWFQEHWIAYWVVEPALDIPDNEQTVNNVLELTWN